MKEERIAAKETTGSRTGRAGRVVFRHTNRKEHKEMMSEHYRGSVTRAVLLLAVMVVALVASSGVALALGKRANSVSCASLVQNPLTPECFGTPQNDDIDGRNAKDIIYAMGGDDYVFPHGGDDVVYGGAGTDNAVGAEGDDLMYGADGADHLTDEAYVAGDTDEQRGGKGNDSLSGYDKDYNDTLVCGAGADDTVYFDKNPTTGAKDTVSDTCEHRHPNQSDGF